MRRKIVGPYRVIRHEGAEKPWEVVEIDEQENAQELRPRKLYVNRQAAYGLCARLNRRWQKDQET